MSNKGMILQCGIIRLKKKVTYYMYVRRCLGLDWKLFANEIVVRWKIMLIFFIAASSSMDYTTAMDQRTILWIINGLYTLGKSIRTSMTGGTDVWVPAHISIPTGYVHDFKSDVYDLWLHDFKYIKDKFVCNNINYLM